MGNQLNQSSKKIDQSSNKKQHQCKNDLENDYDPHQHELGTSHIENKYWKMFRLGQTRSLSQAFKQSLIDCYSIVVEVSGHTLLHEAITLDRRQIFKLCQVYGTNWSQPDIQGVTPLMKASALNKIYYAQQLLQKGVDINLKDNRGYTAMDYANLYQNFDIIDMLKQHLKKQQ